VKCAIYGFFFNWYLFIILYRVFNILYTEYSKRMKPPYDLQKYAFSEKITRIKVVGVMKDFW